MKERHAIAQHTRSSWRFIQSVLQEWRAFAKLLREEQGYLRHRCNLTRLTMLLEVMEQTSHCGASDATVS